MSSIVLFAMLFTSCVKPNTDNVIGDWNAVVTDVNEDTTYIYTGVMSFFEDGTGDYLIDSQFKEFIWYFHNNGELEFDEFTIYSRLIDEENKQEFLSTKMINGFLTKNTILLTK